MKRGALILLLAAAACSKQETSKDLKTYDVQEEAAGPNVSPSAAPGVAFNYRYAFELPDARIATVQEEHASACEKLGLSRCRITGMRYSVGPHDHVSAELSVKLDPTIARGFGKDGIAAVAKAEGKLIDSEITGEDAGAVVNDAGKRAIAARAELAAIEQQLKQPGLTVGTRDNANQRATELRAALSEAQSQRDIAQASLATTPMTFRYASSDSQSGYAKVTTLRDAFGAAWDSVATLISFLLLTVLVIGPWVLAAGALFWLARAIHRRWISPNRAD